MAEYFGLPLFDLESFTIMVSRFLLNGIVLLSISWLYSKSTKKLQNLFTFVLFNISVFFLIYLMSLSDIGIGFGFGLFAIFTILRYRTETIGLRNATYLFLFIMVAAVNGMVSAQISVVELLFIDIMLIAATWAVDQVVSKRQKPDATSNRKSSCSIVYENIENIKLKNRALLIEDLRNRTGLNVIGVKVKDIDFVNGKADLSISYLEDSEQT